MHLQEFVARAGERRRELLLVLLIFLEVVGALLRLLLIRYTWGIPDVLVGHHRRGAEQ
jgi:hypothetical protein